MTKNQKKPKGIIAQLSLLDLWHEWILTLCMILAIAAVLAPLLILLGLKHGTIQTMRDRLIEDPVNREIRPARTLQLSTQWFHEMKQRPDVGFVIPTILRGSSIVKVFSDKGKRLTIDLVPTAENDPLILENEGIVPKTGECVLTYPAAEQLVLKQGDSLTVEVTRSRDGRRESVKTLLKITAVLNPRADSLPRIYAPAQFVSDVESYREGLAVPERKWAGGQPHPFLSYDGVRIVLPQKLNPIAERTLTIGTGLIEIQTLDAETFQETMGFALPENHFAYQLLAKGNPIQISNIKSLKNKLRGKSAILMPFAQNINIQTDSGEKLKIIGLSLSENDAQNLGIPTLPWGKFDESADFSKQGQILLPKDLKINELKADILESKVRFPITAQGESVGNYAIVPAELIGVLRTGTFRHIAFDEKRQNFILAKAGFRGFRLYARSIDDVPILYRLFIDQEIDVLTQVHEIEKVKVLDRGLTRIFWLVAIVGIVGGMAALIASLYAAVERKKRDISVLRLMGLSRVAVFKFPIYQGVSIAIASVIVAIGGYAILALVINFVFSADLKLGQKICTLPYSYFLMTLFVTAGIASLSSLLAAWKTTNIDPAEAIREE